MEELLALIGDWRIAIVITLIVVGILKALKVAMKAIVIIAIIGLIYALITGIITPQQLGGIEWQAIGL